MSCIDREKGSEDRGTSPSIGKRGVSRNVLFYMPLGVFYQMSAKAEIGPATHCAQGISIQSIPAPMYDALYLWQPYFPLCNGNP